jgi:hypothetical protein
MKVTEDYNMKNVQVLGRNDTQDVAYEFPILHRTCSCPSCHSFLKNTGKVWSLTLLTFSALVHFLLGKTNGFSTVLPHFLGIRNIFGGFGLFVLEDCTT